MSLRVKLDENLPRRVEPALRALGIDVETALSEGLSGAEDPMRPMLHDGRYLIAWLIRRMNALSSPPLTESADKVFLALGQTLYACQLLEGTILEIIATADEILDGTGDGKRFYTSLESLSRKTLGQLVHDLRRRADLRADIEDELSSGLEARNFIVHNFAKHVGDDLVNEAQTLVHQRQLYEKCILVMNANDVGIAVLQALGRHHAEKSTTKIADIEAAAEAMRELASKNSPPKH